MIPYLAAIALIAVVRKVAKDKVTAQIIKQKTEKKTNNCDVRECGNQEDNDIIDEKKRPNQVHHYATNKNKKYSPKLKKIADKYDLDLDDIWNKESLPHQGRHPNAYHDFVVDGMKKSHQEAKGDKVEFLKLFDKYVKEPVRKNPDLLRKKGWE